MIVLQVEAIPKLAQYGLVGIVLFVLLIVWFQFREMTKFMDSTLKENTEVQRENTKVLAALAQQVQAGNTQIQELRNDVRRPRR